MDFGLKLCARGPPADLNLITHYSLKADNAKEFTSSGAGMAVCSQDPLSKEFSWLLLCLLPLPPCLPAFLPLACLRHCVDYGYKGRGGG